MRHPEPSEKTDRGVSDFACNLTKTGEENDTNHIAWNKKTKRKKETAQTLKVELQRPGAVKPAYYSTASSAGRPAG